MDELQNRSETDWERLAPVLDNAMRSLGGADRDAIVLRYFEKRDLQGVGAALGISQEAARKRVTRALEKLRGQLARKGVTSTAAALAFTLAGNAITAAPAGFAATLTSTSLAGVAAAGTTFSILGFMTKLQAGIISALLVAATVTPLLIQHRAQARLREKNQMLEQQADRLVQLAAENERLSNLVANASRPVANDQVNELMRLRGQMGALRRQTNELGELQEENRRLKQAASPEVAAGAATAALQSRKAGFARNFALALISYASENQNQFPTNFDQISRYLPAVFQHLPVPTSDLDGFIQATNQFEIVFHGSFDDALTHPGSVVVVRERQAWLTPLGFWAKTYGFADGHCETHTSTDGDFKRWDSTPSDGK